MVGEDVVDVDLPEATVTVGTDADLLRSEERYTEAVANLRKAVELGVAGVVVGGFAYHDIKELLGYDVGLRPGWLVVAVGIALVAGWLGAGLALTILAEWLLALWWTAFPPLVGYLTGAWTGTGRYTHPRTMGFAYRAAEAELIGGLEYPVSDSLSLGMSYKFSLVSEVEVDDQSGRTRTLDEANDHTLRLNLRYYY